jgi:hypothetical protein
MPQRTIRSLSILIALVLASATTALAQSPAPVDLPPAITPVRNMEMTTLATAPAEGWEVARSASPSGGRILVVTVDKPNRRQSCRVQSFTDEKVVCSRGFGDSRTYLKQQVAALILPGDEALTTGLFVGFNAGLGASIWATVALAAACPLCAAGTAVAAFVFFDLAGLTAFTGGEPDRIAYLAPGQKLSPKFNSVLH